MKINAFMPLLLLVPFFIFSCNSQGNNGISAEDSSSNLIVENTDSTSLQNFSALDSSKFDWTAKMYEKDLPQFIAFITAPDAPYNQNIDWGKHKNIKASMAELMLYNGKVIKVMLINEQNIKFLATETEEDYILLNRASIEFNYAWVKDFFKACNLADSATTLESFYEAIFMQELWHLYNRDKCTNHEACEYFSEFISIDHKKAGNFYLTFRYVYSNNKHIENFNKKYSLVEDKYNKAFNMNNGNKPSDKDFIKLLSEYGFQRLKNRYKGLE